MDAMDTRPANTLTGVSVGRKCAFHGCTGECFPRCTRHSSTPSRTMACDNESPKRQSWTQKATSFTSTHNCSNACVGSVKFYSKIFLGRSFLCKGTHSASKSKSAKAHLDPCFGPFCLLQRNLALTSSAGYRSGRDFLNPIYASPGGHRGADGCRLFSPPPPPLISIVSPQTNLYHSARSICCNTT